jgi:hypothetical protein
MQEVFQSIKNKILLNRSDELMDALPNTEEFDEFEILTTLQESYE